MQHKTDFSDEYKEFIQKKGNLITFTQQSLPTRDVAATKKATIIEKLVSLKPANRRVFWEKLPKSETFWT